ncbi:hypothetical protein AAMO2058_000715900 [Amorphochlora amoebiformis]
MFSFLRRSLPPSLILPPGPSALTITRNFKRCCNFSSGVGGVDGHRAIETGWDNGRVVELTPQSMALYAIGIGAGKEKEEERYVYERHPEFIPFPTLPCIWSFYGTVLERVVYDSQMPRIEVISPYQTPIPGFPPIEPFRFLDVGRYIRVYRPLSQMGGFFRITSRHISITDKKIGCIVETEHIVTEAGKPVDDEGPEEKGVRDLLKLPSPPNKEGILARIITSCFIKGLTGFQSAGTPSEELSSKLPAHSRDPDYVVIQETFEEQPLIYRLGSGDMNPLHVDFEVAKAGGLEEPIMHGLCTMGFTARHVLRHVSDPTKFRAMRVRFSSPVLPGARLETSIWDEGEMNDAATGEKFRRFSVTTESEGAVVLNHAYVDTAV